MTPRTLSLLFLSLLAATTQDSPERPMVAHYSTTVELYPASSRLEAWTEIEVVNTTAESVTTIPFLLYRLFRVTSVKDADGRPLAFTQRVEVMEDNERFQVLGIRIHLPAALASGDRTILSMEYSGPFLGATEVWPYMHDRVDETYTLLRPDALAYPVLSGTERLLLGPDLAFTYDLTVGVPAGYQVASGGEEVSRIDEGDRIRFTFRQTLLTWRMDVAAARFLVLREPEHGLGVYYLEGENEDRTAGAESVLNGMRQARDLFTGLFGPPSGVTGFIAIEIPAGWGSQAGHGYMLQTSAAFGDTARLGELYHEIAHSWNAVPIPELQRTRWFDEAFASYFQAIALLAFQGEEAFQGQMDLYRRVFVASGRRNPLHFDIPIREYGLHGLGGSSYTKGAWSLYVLHEIMGDDAFQAAVREFLGLHRDGGATFESFREISERHAGRSLDRYFAEWIDSPTSSTFLADGISIGTIVQRYRPLE